jgi:hypothetical protein
MEASASRTWAGTGGVAAAAFAAGFGAEFCANPASGAMSRTKSAERSTEYLSLQFNGTKRGGNCWQFDAPGRKRESDRDRVGSNTDHHFIAGECIFMPGERILVAGVKNNG